MFARVWVQGVGVVDVAAPVLRGQSVGLLVEEAGRREVVAVPFPLPLQPEDVYYLIEAPAPPEFFSMRWHLNPAQPSRSFFFYSKMQLELSTW